MNIYLIFKRIFDLIVSTVMLILASPVMIAAAVAVKITSKGPVFYRGVRVGMHGELFRIFKFTYIGQRLFYRYRPSKSLWKSAPSLSKFSCYFYV